MSKIFVGFFKNMTFCKIGASHYMHLKTHVLTFIQILMKDISHNNCKIGIIFIHVLISLKYSNGDYQFPLPPPPLPLTRSVLLLDAILFWRNYV